jgi:hypothetical protein
MSQAAQEMQRLADEMKIKEKKPASKKPKNVAVEKKQKQGRNVAASIQVEQSATKGLKKAPKKKAMALNTPAALAVTKKGLLAILADLSGDEKFMAERLLARIAARE